MTVLVSREGFGKTMRLALMVALCLVAVFGANDAMAESDEDYFASIVDFVVSRDPVLASQRTVMEAARMLDTVKLGGSEGVPAYAQGQLLRIRLDSAVDMRQAQEAYSNLERSLVSAVLANMTRISALRNQIGNNSELLVLLQERLEPTERQVQAGLVDANVLWQLSERIINVQIAIADAQAELTAVKRETAFNYGGEDWPELLRLLQEFR